MNRGAVVTVAAGAGYGSKPRPAIVIQSSRYYTTASVTLCLLTTTSIEAPSLRVHIEPTVTNALLKPSFAMIDKVTTVPRSKVDRVIGQLSPSEMATLDRALLVFLGLAG